MQKLSIENIIQKIERQETFHAVAADYSFTIKIDNYVHYVCSAIHDGHQFRKELWDNCLHTEYERWFEEDPATKQMVQTHPILIAGCDSRFEYDLNRAPEDAVFETAWGKQLWHKPLSLEMKAKSLEKHHNFYKVSHALLQKLEELFSVCVVYDIHSYNWKRWDREVSTWNLGITNVDNNRFGDTIELWRRMLEKIKLPNDIISTSNVNDAFQGNGYFLKYITQNFKNTLVLATEVKKVYCDEINELLFPEVVDALEKALQVNVKVHAQSFYNTYK